MSSIKTLRPGDSCRASDSRENNVVFKAAIQAHGLQPVGLATFFSCVTINFSKIPIQNGSDFKMLNPESRTLSMQRVAGIVALMLFATLGLAAMLRAQQPQVHYWHQGVMPPGAIGSRQLMRGGPLPGFFQPVEIKAPSGALISLAVDGQFDEARQGSRKVGLLIGSVYRLRVTGIRLAAGLEVFPTVEIIDRTYAPIGMELRFPIPIELSEDDLRLALEGKFVTRVIYVENPRNALPARENPQAQEWFEVKPGQDPLAVADALGRPVAILRLGGRLPETSASPDPSFLFGCPPFVCYRSEPVKAA